MKNQQSNIVSIDSNAVKSRMLQVRGQQVLLDRDVAAPYGVETRGRRIAVPTALVYAILSSREN